MAGADREGGRQQRPKVTEALDAWLYQRAEFLNRKPDDKDQSEKPNLKRIKAQLEADVQLGYPLETALALWKAWDDHGIMAVAGGYLDQPRQWTRMIELIYLRADALDDAVKAGISQQRLTAARRRR